MKTQLVDAIKDSRFELLPRIVPPEQANLIPTIFRDVQLAFIDSLHSTFLVGVVACAIGALVALLIHNRPAPGAGEKRGEEHAEQRRPSLEPVEVTAGD